MKGYIIILFFFVLFINNNKQSLVHTPVDLFICYL